MSNTHHAHVLPRLTPPCLTASVISLTMFMAFERMNTHYGSLSSLNQCLKEKAAAIFRWRLGVTGVFFRSLALTTVDFFRNVGLPVERRARRTGKYLWTS